MTRIQTHNTSHIYIRQSSHIATGRSGHRIRKRSLWTHACREAVSHTFTLADRLSDQPVATCLVSRRKDGGLAPSGAGLPIVELRGRRMAEGSARWTAGR